jgi:glutamyl-tRNA synthetase
MEITHVIRGEEWINSVPKHLQLYEYFGWQPPVFCHLPLLRNNDATKTKLSKRKNPTSINYFRRAGYLPQALVNFIGLMGWGMPDGRDKFSLAEMLEQFRLEDITLGGPAFDIEKLRWLNGRYMREDFTPAGLLAQLRQWALNDQHLEPIVALAQPRMETMGDWGHLTALFFADAVPTDPAALVLPGQSADTLKAIFQMAIWEMERLDQFDRDHLGALFKRLAEAVGIKLRELTRPFYVAMSGSPASTPLFDSMEILGSDMVRVRLRRAIQALGGLSANQLKAAEKEYAAKFGAPQT